MNRELYLKVIKIVKNRLFILFLGIVFCFWILAQRLFDLQIVNGEQYASNIQATIVRTISIPSLRGNIYDRYGRPLAVNEPAFNVIFDTNIVNADLNGVIYQLLNTLEKNNESFIDDLPITKDEPFAFTFHSPSSEKCWKVDMGLQKEQLDYTASETIEYLRKFFKIPENLTNIDARNMISIRSAIYMQRYRQYNTITVARDVNQEVVVEMEERNNKYTGIYIDVVPLRSYPEGESFSHILGYISPINEEELKEYEDYGYTKTDLIGKIGIEKAYELTLNGQKGEEVVDVTATGKVMNRVETVSSTNGENVFLTLDSKLQQETANILIENLKDVLIKKLDSGEITIKQLFTSMVESNNISIKKVMNADDEFTQSILKTLILKDNPKFNINKSKDLEKAKEIIINAIEEDAVTTLQFILCLVEQKIISCDEETLMKLHNGTASSYMIIKEKISTNEISPRATNLDPCTGSVSVVDVNSGDVLALVSYPTYDNNMLVNTFNNEYYEQLLNDPTTPLINRPLMERKAPGSTLKMLSAIAGLESGVINPSTKIQDLGIFKSAGLPYAKCLIYSRYGLTHGAVDVSKAIEVSCNYFFYETAYRMGNAKKGTTLNGITTFNDYIKKFGLDDYSGVEIEEYKPKMASPKAKENAIKAIDNNATASQMGWMDGDSIRNAIGQSFNSYTVIHMAKYIATLANGGTRYKLNLVKGTKAANDIEMNKVLPIVEEELNFAPENLEAVFEGMLGVTSGSQGTLRNVFADFPIQVAAKTGTAEESDKRPSHTWFTGFAPYENPQIAIVVMIPFGESSTNIAPQIAKEIFAEYFGLNKEQESPIYENSIN
ncbi:MAG: hypothetical protein CVU84_14545 [Firmicutes bacterium HGW-Firmicutes-1]|jgi:cell division protein FtsI/penicillin-binding protein 2|nr:MAG: hypothetical protein CVU84_14545 [Firmicutes bacterium HGW-Firmicutes-1]